MGEYSQTFVQIKMAAAENMLCVETEIHALRFKTISNIFYHLQTKNEFNIKFYEQLHCAWKFHLVVLKLVYRIQLLTASTQFYELLSTIMYYTG